MHAKRSRPRLVVSSDGRGVVSHGLTGAFTVDLATMLADGGETVTDLALLRDQAAVFGAVISTPRGACRPTSIPPLWRHCRLPVPPHTSPAADARLYLRTAAPWPWRQELANAFARLAALHRPAI